MQHNSACVIMWSKRLKFIYMGDIPDSIVETFNKKGKRRLRKWQLKLEVFRQQGGCEHVPTMEIKY